MSVEKTGQYKFRAVGTVHNVAYLRHAKPFTIKFSTNMLHLWCISNRLFNEIGVGIFLTRGLKDVYTQLLSSRRGINAIKLSGKVSDTFEVSDT